MTPVPKPARVFGSELNPGDTIGVWWAPNRDTILALSPYTGPLEYPAGARMALFALNKTGMTIDSGRLFDRLTKGPVEAPRRVVAALKKERRKYSAGA